MDKVETKKMKKHIVKPKIMVIGDVMLDGYIEGEVKRISPEAPIPILNIKTTSYSLGGAANVAKNLCSLGIIPYLIGYVGNDNDGKIFRELVERDKIKHKLFDTAITTSKRRYGYPQMLRTDKEEKVKIKKKDLTQIVKYIEQVKPSEIIISDYAKGTITQSLYDKVIKLSKEIKYKVIVDPKPKNNIDYKGCFLMTPNLEEAVQLSNEHNIKDIGNTLKTKYQCNVIITRGKDGMDLFSENNHYHISSINREIYNVSGAGDAVTSSVTYLLSLGWFLPDTIEFVNRVAGDVVSTKSTSINKGYKIT
jgi:D-beta-D-heptose 7-phosphate kinase/D-beta-D-heptose 1-phosphate adenosyltransferase